jgi:hypothetical protein
MQIFGSGVLWGTPIQDASGNAIANPSPVNFGTLQEVSVDISFDTKMLYGSQQFAIDVGRGKGKISCKAKLASINGALFNSLFFGQTLVSGLVSDVFDTIGTVVPSTPFTITPTVPNAGAWSVDLGVRSGNGVPLTRVASAPTTGQYSVAAGVYTFAAADTGLLMFISYQYTAASTVAKKGNISNLLMGAAPTFRADIFVPRQPKAMVWTFNQCISSKLSFATKQDDFIIPEMDFDVYADPNGNVASWALSE